MTQVLSVGTSSPPYKFTQEESLSFARNFFQDAFPNIERLLKVFETAQIDTRYFSAPMAWFKTRHSLQEKNDLYINQALACSIDAVQDCLHAETLLDEAVACEDIDAIFFVSTTGFSTPSIEAKLMNHLPFSPHTKRMPIWGLGCAGGASGLSRAHEYCLAYPQANVLVVAVELCSLTFQPDDRSKSNLIGTSLFADGAACALVSGDDSALLANAALDSRPHVLATQSTFMPDSEEVMGWNVRDEGLYVVFSRSIPGLIEGWLRPDVTAFLDRHGLGLEHVSHLIAHPGGRKVLEAYESSLALPEGMTTPSREVLRHYGNMSSPTVLYVLKEHMEKNIAAGDFGVATALGPGFSSELLLLQWEA